jgi:hypothetical protein
LNPLQDAMRFPPVQANKAQALPLVFSLTNSLSAALE